MMEMTAGRLGIELEVIACDRDSRLLRERGLELCARANTPEYLLLVNEGEVGSVLLPKAARKGIRVLTLCQGFSTADRLTLGRPREKYETWLGELLPDDRRAGAELAELLVAEARRKGLHGADGRLNLLAVSGPFTNSSVQRLNGLRAAVSEASDVVLQEVAPAGWNEERAFWVVADMLKRRPDASILWAANDTMALGAARAVADTGREILIGGVDWASFVPDQIRRGAITYSMGGHFFDGSWALLLLYDYHQGHDFPDLEMRSSFTAMGPKNVERYEGLLRPGTWKAIDLARFSRAEDPELGPFEISADMLL